MSTSGADEAQGELVSELRTRLAATGEGFVGQEVMVEAMGRGTALRAEGRSATGTLPKSVAPPPLGYLDPSAIAAAAAARAVRVAAGGTKFQQHITSSVAAGAACDDASRPQRAVAGLAPSTTPTPAEAPCTPARPSAPTTLEMAFVPPRAPAVPPAPVAAAPPALQPPPTPPPPPVQALAPALVASSTPPSSSAAVATTTSATPPPAPAKPLTPTTTVALPRAGAAAWRDQRSSTGATAVGAALSACTGTRVSSRPGAHAPAASPTAVPTRVRASGESGWFLQGLADFLTGAGPLFEAPPRSPSAPLATAVLAALTSSEAGAGTSAHDVASTDGVGATEVAGAADASKAVEATVAAAHAAHAACAAHTGQTTGQTTLPSPLPSREVAVHATVTHASIDGLADNEMAAATPPPIKLTTPPATPPTTPPATPPATPPPMATGPEKGEWSERWLDGDATTGETLLTPTESSQSDSVASRLAQARKERAKQRLEGLLTVQLASGAQSCVVVTAPLPLHRHTPATRPPHARHTLATRPTPVAARRPPRTARCRPPHTARRRPQPPPARPMQQRVLFSDRH